MNALVNGLFPRRGPARPFGGNSLLSSEHPTRVEGKAVARLDKRAYAQAAQFNRLTYDSIRSAVSPDTEVRADIRVLRNRARTLVRDNPYARRFVSLLLRNVIGRKGIQAIPDNLGADGKPAKKANKALYEAFTEWSRKDTASISGRYSWKTQQRLLLRHCAIDGEMILRKWPGFDNAFGYALEVVDPDLLDEQYSRAPDRQGNQIKMGIELNKFGRPLNYYFRKSYPGELAAIGANERLCVPAEQIEHVFIPMSAGQTRGLSWFAPVLMDARMLAGYQEAVLVAARTAASRMGFFVHKGSETDPSYLPPDSGGGAEERLVMNATPGLMTELPPGMEVQTWDPHQPSTVFDQFNQAILGSMAMGLDVAAMSLTGDLRGANYSSARVGLLDERDSYSTLQEWFGEDVNHPVYQGWLPMASISSKLSLPSEDFRRWQSVRWQGRGWDWVDPAKDISAAAMEIGLGLNSRTRILRERGEAEYEDVIVDLAEEDKTAEALHVDITGAKVTIKETAVPANVEDAVDNAPAPAQPGQPIAASTNGKTKPAGSVPAKVKSSTNGTARDDDPIVALTRMIGDVLAGNRLAMEGLERVVESQARLISVIAGRPIPTPEVHLDNSRTVHEAAKPLVQRDITLRKNEKGETIGGTMIESLIDVARETPASEQPENLEKVGI